MPHLFLGAEMDKSNSGEFLSLFQALGICAGLPWDSLFQPIRWRLFLCPKKSWNTLHIGTLQSKRLYIVKNTAVDSKQVRFVGQTLLYMMHKQRDIKLWCYTWNIYLKTIFYITTVAFVLQRTENKHLKNITGLWAVILFYFLGVKTTWSKKKKK